MIDRAAIEAEIQAADTARRAAMLAGDVATLERLIAPDAVYIHNSGLLETGLEYLDSVRHGQYAYTRVDLVDCRYRIHDGVVVVSGTQHMEAGLAGGPAHRLAMLAVIVWERREGGWMLVHFQSTRLPES